MQLGRDKKLLDLYGRSYNPPPQPQMKIKETPRGFELILQYLGHSEKFFGDTEDAVRVAAEAAITRIQKSKAR